MAGEWHFRPHLVKGGKAKAMKEKGTIRAALLWKTLRLPPLVSMADPDGNEVDPSFEFGGVKDVDGIGADSDSD